MKKKLTPAEIADKFGIEPLVPSGFGVITAEDAAAAIKAFAERMLTTAVVLSTPATCAPGSNIGKTKKEARAG